MVFMVETHYWKTPNRVQEINYGRQVSREGSTVSTPSQIRELPFSRELYTWGSNENGCLGIGTTPARGSAPWTPPEAAPRTILTILKQSIVAVNGNIPDTSVKIQQQQHQQPPQLQLQLATLNSAITSCTQINRSYAQNGMLGMHQAMQSALAGNPGSLMDGKRNKQDGSEAGDKPLGDREFPIAGLHDRILEESKKRGRRNACGLLKEIEGIERSARRGEEQTLRSMAKSFMKSKPAVKSFMKSGYDRLRFIICPSRFPLSSPQNSSSSRTITRLFFSNSLFSFWFWKSR
ncbi:hypothetical protein LXL04_017830 [Taraxacum kok-saghyz]